MFCAQPVEHCGVIGARAIERIGQTIRPLRPFGSSGKIDDCLAELFFRLFHLTLERISPSSSVRYRARAKNPADYETDEKRDNGSDGKFHAASLNGTYQEHQPIRQVIPKSRSLTPPCATFPAS